MNKKKGNIFADIYEEQKPKKNNQIIIDQEDIPHHSHEKHEFEKETMCKCVSFSFKKQLFSCCVTLLFLALPGFVIYLSLPFEASHLAVFP